MRQKANRVELEMKILKARQLARTADDLTRERLEALATELERNSARSKSNTAMPTSRSLSAKAADLGPASFRTIQTTILPNERPQECSLMWREILPANYNRRPTGKSRLRTRPGSRFLKSRSRRNASKAAGDRWFRDRNNLFSPLVLGTGHIAIDYPNDLPEPDFTGVLKTDRY